MPERPEVTAAKEKLASLLPAALNTMESLLESPSEGARLGAARDILDRGGVPVSSAVEVTVEIGIDDQIGQFLSRLSEARRIDREGTATLLGGSPAIEVHEPTLFDDLDLQPVPELIAAQLAADDEVAEAEIVGEAWWQAGAELG